MWKKGFLAMAVIFAISCSLQVAPVYAEYVRAYSMPGFFNGSPIDHTYACVGMNDCYSTNGSRASGGTYVTRGYVSDRGAQLSKCYAGCSFVFAKNGVCHQHGRVAERQTEI